MLRSARALAYTIWRLAKPNSNEIFGGGRRKQHTRRVRASNPFSSANDFSAVKNPREGSAPKFSFSGDLRYGDGLSRRGASRARFQSHRFGRKCLSTDVDLSGKERHRAQGRVSR